MSTYEGTNEQWRTLFFWRALHQQSATAPFPSHNWPVFQQKVKPQFYEKQSHRRKGGRQQMEYRMTKIGSWNTNPVFFWVKPLSHRYWLSFREENFIKQSAVAFWANLWLLCANNTWWILILWRHFEKWHCLKSRKWISLLTQYKNKENNVELI